MGSCSDSKTDLPGISFREKPLATFAASLDECLDPDDPGMKKCAAFADALCDVDTTTLDVDTALLEVNPIVAKRAISIACSSAM